MICDQDFLELINSLDEPYFEASSTGEILLHNRALKKLVGDAVGKQIFDLFAGIDRARLQEIMPQASSTRHLQEIILTMRSTGESPQYVKLTVTSMEKVDSHGAPCLRCRLHIVDYDKQIKEGLVEAQHALKKQTKDLAILNHLSVSISSSLDLDEVLNSICREIVGVFDARNTGIALLNDAQTALQVVAFHTEHPDESNITGLQIPLEGNDASLFVIKTGEPIVVPDAQFNPITNSVHDLMVRRGTSCLLIVPLLTRGDIIGTIGIPSDSQTIFSREDVQLAMTIAGQVAGAIDNARLHRTVQAARDDAELELEIGRQIQTGFFPDSLPQIKGWDVFAYFQSARKVAGDFYDAFPLNRGSQLAVVLADVCDKGLGAALFMVVFRSLLRANIQQSFDCGNETDMDPGERIIEAVRKTNNYVALNHAKASMFATVFIAILERDRNEVWYANCGHDPPFLFRANGKNDRLMPTNPAIGAFPDLRLSSKSLYMRPGDSIFACTDGVGDARSAEGKCFGEDRLLNILRKNITLSQRLNYLTDQIISHTNGTEQYDDITCIAFSRK
jgi:serine phosphatase RsbU (regulator of sigma subunit)